VGILACWFDFLGNKLDTPSDRHYTIVAGYFSDAWLVYDYCERPYGICFANARSGPPYDILEFCSYGNRSKFGKLYSKQCARTSIRAPTGGTTIMNIDSILQTITVGSSILMILAILLQQRGASLGAGFGSSGELYTTRRGLDKNLFEATIVLAVIFILSILVGLLLPAFNL
jgi:preprotein translocase subunit SecG